MVSKVRRFERPLGNRPYKKIFVLSVEGQKTEPQYFSIFNDQNSIIQINCLKSNKGNAPLQVLKRIEKYINSNPLKSTDEAWIVVDKDQWTENQLIELHKWAKKEKNYGFVLSNPKFEYWLLLHFESGDNIGTSAECTERLRRHLPNYDKGIDRTKFNLTLINTAIKNAKKRTDPSSDDWPRIVGSTTVYRLVENILASKNPK